MDLGCSTDGFSRHFRVSRHFPARPSCTSASSPTAALWWHPHITHCSSASPSPRCSTLATSRRSKATASMSTISSLSRMHHASRCRPHVVRDVLGRQWLWDTCSSTKASKRQAGYEWDGMAILDTRTSTRGKQEAVGQMGRQGWMGIKDAMESVQELNHNKEQ